METLCAKPTLDILDLQMFLPNFQKLERMPPAKRALEVRYAEAMTKIQRLARSIVDEMYEEDLRRDQDIAQLAVSSSDSQTSEDPSLRKATSNTNNDAAQAKQNESTSGTAGGQDQLSGKTPPELTTPTPVTAKITAVPIKPVSSSVQPQSPIDDPTIREQVTEEANTDSLSTPSSPTHDVTTQKPSKNVASVPGENMPSDPRTPVRGEPETKETDDQEDWITPKTKSQKKKEKQKKKPKNTLDGSHWNPPETDKRPIKTRKIYSPSQPERLGKSTPTRPTSSQINDQGPIFDDEPLPSLVPRVMVHNSSGSELEEMRDSIQDFRKGGS